MVITFQSAASGDVMMFEKNAKDVLRALGKDPDPPPGHRHRRTIARRDSRPQVHHRGGPDEASGTGEQ